MKTQIHLPKVLAGGSLVFAVLLAGETKAADQYAPKPPVPEGYLLVEGDILVRNTRASFDSYNLWPNHRVPYEFDANVSELNKSRMRAAMDVWEAVVNITFYERDDEDDYVHIQNSTDNNSEVGRAGGEQIINITSWDQRYRMVHELGHTLGFFHEQSRSDRDSYIKIHWDNIQDSERSNFFFESTAFEYGPYDFDSVMHYGACYFSKCDPCDPTSDACRTIEVLAPNDTQWQTKIGQRTHLSKMDIMTMSFLYPEPDWFFADSSYFGLESASFFEPANTLARAEDWAWSGSTIWMQPGTYSESGVHNKAVTLRAPLGEVTIGKP